ncbi:hypothetical protein FS842_008350 [Serendipita sp. 407]|nr:hypothetical protein FS842_008350 [Serendipita sp. 407]
MTSIAPALIVKLREIEQDTAATFTSAGFCVRSSGSACYYVKTGSPLEMEQYQGECSPMKDVLLSYFIETGETKSLEAIEQAAAGLAPRVFSVGYIQADEDEEDEDEEENQRSYMISEYKFLQPLSGDRALELARRLALELHAFKSDRGFGFECATYCGATRTQGRFFESWAACFADMIQSLLSTLRDQPQWKEVVNLGDQIVSTVIPFLLGPPLDVDPVLLHGDLWSGNVGVDSNTSQPIIYDPASYFGHNEAELSIMRMFGGFAPSFFQEYHKHRPKAHPVSEYDKRQLLYELFHYLNHTCIFRVSLLL